MTFSLFILTMLAAITTENLMFSYSLGINKWFLKVRSIYRILISGGIFTLVSVLANITYYVINQFLLALNLEYINYIKHFIMLFIIFSFFLIIYFLVYKLLPQYIKLITTILPITLFNTALLSTFHVVATRFGENNSLFNTALYSFSLGIGYTAATLIIYLAKKRLLLSPIPKNFKGTPIILIYIGIFSLGLFGLIGYGISA